MSESSLDEPGFRESILKSSFDKVGFDQALGLVGILFEYRIVFSKKFWSLLREHQVDIDLEPLEPQAAAVLVGDLFGLDCDRLFLAFTNDWRRMRNTAMVGKLITTIESHEYVDRLEPIESL